MAPMNKRNANDLEDYLPLFMVATETAMCQPAKQNVAVDRPNSAHNDRRVGLNS